MISPAKIRMAPKTVGSAGVNQKAFHADIIADDRELLMVTSICVQHD